MKRILFIIGLVLAFSVVITTTSCTPKVGCELTENMGPKTDRRGNLSTKKGKSNLFDKKSRKRMNRR